MKIIDVGGKPVKVYGKEEAGRAFTDSEIEMDRRATAAVEAVINQAKICNKPIARYDEKIKKAYLEYPDGSRVYVN